MALVFPRDLTDLTRWSAPKLKLEHRQELSRRQGGLTQAKDMGPSLWVADWASVPIRLDDADAVMAQFSSLRGSLRTFYLYPFTRPQPRQTGAQGGALGNVSVQSIDAGNAALTLQGLPSGFELVEGDYLSITTQVGGREFLRLNEGRTAGGTGLAVDLGVEPYVRAGVAPGDTVTLVKPLVEMRLDPGTLDDPFDGLSHRMIKFKATQVIR